MVVSLISASEKCSQSQTESTDQDGMGAIEKKEGKPLMAFITTSGFFT